MKIGVLGTGMVGTTLGTKLIQLGHEVKMGSRQAGNEKAVEWAGKAGPNASEGSFADAAAFGEVVLNATNGSATLEALEAAGSPNLAGKVLIDVSNPLDYSKGMPPTLTVCNDDSMAEQIQRTFPEARVVKTLNTLTAPLMVAPETIGSGHVIFVGGNDSDAKNQVVELLTSFGWPKESIIDLGDITSARGTEMYLPLWVRMMMVNGSPIFNIRVIKGEV
jgi:predicted dinucleotide-binding enzyme